MLKRTDIIDGIVGISVLFVMRNHTRECFKKHFSNPHTSLYKNVFLWILVKLNKEKCFKSAFFLKKQLQG